MTSRPRSGWGKGYGNKAEDKAESLAGFTSALLEMCSAVKRESIRRKHQAHHTDGTLRHRDPAAPPAESDPREPKCQETTGPSGARGMQLPWDTKVLETW